MVRHISLPLVHPAGFSRRAGLSRAASAMAWAPLVGRSTADILEQHPDPLAALQRADIPAIV
eukprot:2360376-Prymnesium_polylepis.1